MNKYKVIYYLSIYSCVYRKSFGYDWKPIWLVYIRRRQVPLLE